MALADIRIVLVNTTHPGNIGAAARAMKAMGLSKLALVNPCDHLCAEAIARASGADDILEQALVCSKLEEALADCRIVYGTSGRVRALPWPLQNPEQMAKTVLAADGPCAIVFGRERDGLTNEELQQCTYQVCIPTSDDFKSLNLAQAVQVLTYELRKQLDTGVSAPITELPVDAAGFEGLITHLQSVMIKTGFLNEAHPKKLMQRVRRVFHKATLDQSETNMLRGVLTSVEKKLAGMVHQHGNKTEN